jgi:hypothetical protein
VVLGGTKEVVAALAEYFRLDRQLLLKLMKIHAGRSTSYP